MVDRQTIDSVRSAAADCSESELEREFEEFFKNQPDLCDFVMDLTSSGPPTAGELALYMCYVVYKATMADRDGPLNRVTSKEITDACSESGDWVHRMSEIDATKVIEATKDIEIQSPSPSKLDDEPHLMGYVISEVHDALKGGLDLGEEEKGAVFFVLTAVISSLTANSN